MNKVVNWFLLLIIFVFDPLAIAMVIAANMAFAQIKPKIKDLSPEQISRELDKNVIEVKPTLFTGEVTGSCPPGLKYNTPYTVDEIKEKWSKAEKDIEEGKNVYGEDRLEKIEEFIKKSQGTDKRGNRIWKADIDF